MLVRHKLFKNPIELPDIVDVLVHLPMSEELRDEGYCAAHAIQYNICAKGPTVEDALARLTELVGEHCRQALNMGIHPLNMAQGHYMKAFFLGVSIPCKENINARLSSELAATLHLSKQVRIMVDVRSVCKLQEKRKFISVEELVEVAA